MTRAVHKTAIITDSHQKRITVSKSSHQSPTIYPRQSPLRSSSTPRITSCRHPTDCPSGRVDCSGIWLEINVVSHRQLNPCIVIRLFLRQTKPIHSRTYSPNRHRHPYTKDKQSENEADKAGKFFQTPPNLSKQDFIHHNKPKYSCQYTLTTHQNNEQNMQINRHTNIYQILCKIDKQNISFFTLPSYAILHS